jgi:hypothetical protein
MKTTHLFAVALLGLATSFTAHAQTPVVGAPGAMSTPGSPATTGTVVPGQTGTALPGAGVGTVTGAGTVSPNATTPIGTSGTTMYPNGVPARNVDGGTLRSDQPVGNPATSGSQPTRTLNNRTRTTTTGTSTRP